MHLLGSVTDKIVATPDFDIGQRAATFTSTPSSSSSLQQQGGGGSTEEEEVSSIMATFQEEAAKAMNIKNEVV
jgi:hypothetical protein